MTKDAKCPFHHAAGEGTSNKDWWPNQLRVDLLNQHSSKSNPLGEKFNYTEEFNKLDYKALKADLIKLMTDRQPGLVASRLRPLWSSNGPHGLARSWHLPHP